MEIQNARLSPLRMAGAHGAAGCCQSMKASRAAAIRGLDSIRLERPSCPVCMEYGRLPASARAESASIDQPTAAQAGADLRCFQAVRTIGLWGDPRSKATASTIHFVASQGARRDFGAANPITISTSNDGGRTFSEPVQVLFNNLNNNVRSAVSLPDGSMAVVFSTLAHSMVVDWSSFECG